MGTDKGEGAACGGDLSYDGAVSSLGREPVPVTSEMINALPEPVRRFIHDLEAQVERWQQNAVQSSVAAGQLGAQALELDHEVKRLRRELAAWRTLALDNTDVPGMQDDIEEDGKAILRLKLERLELANRRAAAADAFTRPHFVTMLDEAQDDNKAILRLENALTRMYVRATPLEPLGLYQMPPAPQMGAPKHADPWAGSLVVRATMALDAKTGEMVAVEGGSPPKGKKG